MHQPAILLSASEVAELLDHRALLDGLHSAMCSYASGPVPARRAFSNLPSGAPHSVMIVFPGVVPGIPAYTVKINAKLPNSVPSVRGIIALHDLESGHLLAVMDSMTITQVRTALVGAIAANALARKTVRTVAVLGAGVQGRAQLRALRLVRRFESVRVYDYVPTRARALTEDLGDMDVTFSVASTAEEAAKDADVIITATWSKTPLLRSEMIADGAHITAIGADEPGKAELSADLIQRSRFIADDERLAVEMGALGGVGLTAESVHALLGDVLSGSKEGRTDDDQVTIFGSVGLPCQDLPAAWMAYQQARARGGAHTTFDFHR